MKKTVRMRGMTPHQGTDPRPLPDEPLALDLLNTQWLPSGTPVDLLATPTGTQAWLAAAGAAASPVPGTEETLAQARQVIPNVASGHAGRAPPTHANPLP